MAARTPHLSLANHLQSRKAPWAGLLVLKAGQRAESAVEVPDGFVRPVLHGAKCRSTAGLFAEFAHAMAFPDYFGHNWDALEECLADLEWLPGKGYVLLFTDADQILPDDEDEFAAFLEVVSDAGEAWASGQAGMQGRGARPFHVMLTVSERGRSKRVHWRVPLLTVQPARRVHKGRRPARGC